MRAAAAASHHLTPTLAPGPRIFSLSLQLLQRSKDNINGNISYDQELRSPIHLIPLDWLVEIKVSANDGRKGF